MTQYTIQAQPRAGAAAPKLGKKAITSIESTMRTTAEVVRIDEKGVWVKPVAQAMAQVEPILVEVMPLYYKAMVNVGCKGIHQPLPTDKEVHAWQPSRHDANCIRLTDTGEIYVPKA